MELLRQLQFQSLSTRPEADLYHDCPSARSPEPLDASEWLFYADQGREMP